MRSTYLIITKGAGIEEITDQHAGGVAEHLIGGIASAAQGRFIDHIVVQQSGGVDEFDDGGRIDVAVPRVPASAGRQKHQKGT